MLNAKEVSNIDNFGDELIFDVIVDCNYKGLINKAKKIDKENFTEDCFTVRVTFDEDGFHILNENGDSELYYVDNQGEYVSLKYMLKDKEKRNVFRICANNILEDLKGEN